MPEVRKWRSKRRYTVAVMPNPSSVNQWILELLTAALLIAPATLDGNGEPVFSVPLDELLAHVALPSEVDPTEVDFRLMPDGVSLGI
jgi:hypothetical protein